METSHLQQIHLELFTSHAILRLRVPQSRKSLILKKHMGALDGILRLQLRLILLILPLHLLVTIPAFPTSMQTMGGREGLTTTGLTPASLGYRGWWVGPPELPEVIEGGRDPFAPGDRVFWQLPVLTEPGEESDPATRAADWLEVVAPLMVDLTTMSGIWWQRVIAESQDWYAKWAQAPAVETGLIRPTQSAELQELRFRRLESRAYAMLQSAVPSMIRDELVANREVHHVALVFHVLRVYQPGVLQERTALFESLSNPGASNTAADAILKAWIIFQIRF